MGSVPAARAPPQVRVCARTAPVRLHAPADALLTALFRVWAPRLLLRARAHERAAQVVPEVCKVDAEHEALCREAIVQARQQAHAPDTDREVVSAEERAREKRER